MKYVLWFLRIVVGVLFIFSGLVKANDPLGLSYKMKEFFEVWHTEWLSDYALMFSVLMIAFEIIAGVALLLGFAFRVFSFLLLLLTTFFTFLTAYVYYWDIIRHSAKVKECGCFGDCIPLSNTATFWKDIVLLALVVIIFLYRKRIRPAFSNYPGTALMILSIFFAFGFQWWTLEHLPVHDCLAYKVGNNLWEKSQLPPGATPPVFETVLTYEKDGVKKEFSQSNYPWQDSTWVFVDSKTKLIKEGSGEAPIKDFKLSDYDGNDHTEEVLKAKGKVFLFFLRDVNKARTDNLERLKKLLDEAEQQNIPTYILSSGEKEPTAEFLKKWGLVKFQLLIVDGTASKTGMRTNPGLMLLNDGTVEGKWSFRDYPKQMGDVK
ncbi:BT_3928 family protein [Chitinophagaceae bacterium MMS25-I14]